MALILIFPLGVRADQISEVGDSFESLMLNQLYTQMQNSNRILSAGDDNPFAPSHAEAVFGSMRDQIVVEQMARQKPLGISEMVQRQLRGLGGVGQRPQVR